MDRTADEMAYDSFLRGTYTYEEYVDVCRQEECAPRPYPVKVGDKFRINNLSPLQDFQVVAIDKEKETVTIRHLGKNMKGVQQSGDIPLHSFLKNFQGWLRYRYIKIDDNRNDITE